MKKVMTKGFLFSFLCSLFLVNSFVVSAENQGTAEEELRIIAHVTATKAEYKADLLKAFQAVVEGTRKEPGNVSYVLCEHADNPLKFTFIEVWKSQDAINLHNNSPHFQQFAKAIDGKAALEVYTMKKKY